MVDIILSVVMVVSGIGIDKPCADMEIIVTPSQVVEEVDDSEDCHDCCYQFGYDYGTCTGDYVECNCRDWKRGYIDGCKANEIEEIEEPGHTTPVSDEWVEDEIETPEEVEGGQNVALMDLYGVRDTFALARAI